MSRGGRRLAAVALAAGLLLGTVPAVAAPGPPDAPEYWFDTWQIPRLWSQGARGQGIRIAEIDTGVNAALPELRGRVLAGTDFGRSGDGRTDRQQDEFGHGTAMASIMVGRPGTLGITGIAPDARVLPIAVPLSGTSDASSDDHLGAAIRWAADHGADVISMSLGGRRDPSSDSEPCAADEQAAVFYALRKGAVVLAAAGNRGKGDNAVEEPGVCLGVVAVGATDRSGEHAPFSSRHPYVAFTAPGVNVPSLSRVAGLAYAGNGTSQATAIASAVVALVWSKHPKLTGQQVIARVLATLDGRRSKPDPAYGWGQLDGYRAVTATVPAGAPNPIYAAAAPFAARANAFAKAARVKPPAPAAKQIGSTGEFRIGSSPRLLVPRVLGALAVALAGLLALIALAVVALLRRRPAEPPVPPTPAGPRVQVDDDGVQWHAIIERTAPE
ncbi:S8 family serine peptidase [Jatrophihabitans cynanchi]|jgi:type VII secretion-associated serine protease mycosin|uniref:S8 family serine peptidase n=1 Tax=Jatrophihabitans cynanchi TaxID=2944128 RepID=A0ABY7K432_9ACTN|nr:S8 family serine peptidase [Jatrophihabitans sp. SB3-54]WAX59253.1 S8 family serine peptidase [Jatrophihabitans sp. SB3-54]